MDCETAKTAIQQYLDGRLDRETASELLSHVQSCARCMDEMKRISALITALQKIPQAEPPEGLLESAADRAKKELITQKSPWPKRAAAIAAAVVITAAAGWHLFFNGREDAAAPDSAENTVFMAEAENAAPQAQAEEAAPMQCAPAEREAPSEAAGQKAAEKESCDGTASDLSVQDVTVLQVASAVRESFEEELRVLFAQYGVEMPTRTAVQEDALEFDLPEDMETDFLSLLDKYRVAHDESGLTETIRILFITE